MSDKPRNIRYIDDELYREAMKQAYTEGIKIGELMNRAIKLYLEESTRLEKVKKEKKKEA